MNVEENIVKLGLNLPPPPSPVGLYKPILVVGDLAYLSGHGPVENSGNLTKGKVGEDLSIEEGKSAARQVGLTLLATIKNHFGKLEQICRVVKLLGLVNCPSGVVDHPTVINGCSELFSELFGANNGIGVRSAIGTNSLPGNIPVEIEAIFQLR